ncbi:Uncharacterized protein OS=Anaeromyxobacter sp. (strain K) GN=AnaeK_2907 PE=4 SV=1 [Gemmataceae bacterium]|nr:Uncharacterized protein OS=Anaeromyxobacter sp. (strain K) GN=AnaeK_2907 PE=4 SV=1 [Gemmataceae bacterium]VTT96927.1 Uncharacterized protein OS=Anaeromyxobacter sp. (strain K) GN=AnaeK_2907 PE=4 SV=1 [Gemmataceae bacterium]
MTLPRWLSPGAVAFLAIWLVLMAFGPTGMLRDPGTFWHTRTGDLILAEGFIRTDPYTFTHPAYPDRWWVPYQWLGEVGMALAHRVAGFDAQLLGAVTIIAATFAFLAVRLLATGLNFVLVGAIMGVALAAAGAHFHVRPHLVTTAGMALLASVLVECDGGRVRVPQLFWLVPAFVVWANVHGGYLGGFGTLVIAAAGWVVFWALGRPTPVKSRGDVGLLALLVVLSGAAALVNPYGTDMLKVWRVIMGEPILREIIKEHRPLELDDANTIPVLLLGALYLLTLAGLSWREVRVSWLLPLVWLAQTVERCRHATLFVVVALVAIAAMWPHTRWAARLAKDRPDFYDPASAPAPRPWWASVWLPALVVLLTLALEASGTRVPVVGAGWAVHEAEHWPVEVLDALKANEPQPGETHNKVFNDYVDGAFVIYHAPGYKVFVDDRCEVFGGQWLYDFVRASSSDTPAAVRTAMMEQWQADYGRFDFALTRPGTPFDDYFRTARGWACVKRTGTAAFYRRE